MTSSYGQYVKQSSIEAGKPSSIAELVLAIGLQHEANWLSSIAIQQVRLYLHLTLIWCNLEEAARGPE
jgi:hypothetical protein